MKKVLFVINTLGHAGAEVAMLELLRRMKNEQTEISLFVLTGQGELVKRLPKDIKLLNKDYCPVSVLSDTGRKYLRSNTLKACFRKASLIRNFPYVVVNGVRQLAKKRIQADKLLWRVLSDSAEVFDEEYDLAVSFLEGGSAYYVADHVKAKKKAAFIHIDYNSAGYTRKLDKDCYLKFDKIFTVSEETKGHFLSAYPECKSYTYAFHNILDENRISSLAEEDCDFGDDFNGYRIVTVGRLVYQKGYDIAIEAMELIKKEGLPVRWYILGEGNLHNELQELIDKAGLKNEFVLLGAKENPYPYVAKADLYVHATRFEGKSIAIQEAQVLAKPIVASDCSGNREQIESGVDGILCKLNPEDIKNAIVYMYEHGEAASVMGIKASEKQNAYEKDLDMLTELLSDAKN